MRLPSPRSHARTGALALCLLLGGCGLKANLYLTRPLTIFPSPATALAPIAVSITAPPAVSVVPAAATQEAPQAATLTAPFPTTAQRPVTPP